MIKDAILYGWRSKLLFIEGKVAANSFNNTIFNTTLPRICCVTFIREKTGPRVADVCVRNFIDTNIEKLPWSAFLRSIPR